MCISIRAYYGKVKNICIIANSELVVNGDLSDLHVISMYFYIASIVNRI